MNETRAESYAVTISRNATLGEWPDPTPAMLADPLFEAIWQIIKHWDINVPDAYSGYSGATGNHVRAIVDGIRRANNSTDPTPELPAKGNMSDKAAQRIKFLGRTP